MQTDDENILLIDKPKSITSFDCIRKLRRKLGIRKMGHAGTLDPIATGLMIIGINEGTKKLSDYLKLDKIYRAKILLGEKRDTADADGNLIEEKEVRNIEEEKLKEVLKKMKGVINLSVPAYSAVKVKGRKLCEIARAGEKITLPKKQMKIYWIKLLRTERLDKKFIIEIKLKVASGTYIRSIAEKLGENLGYPASIIELRRTQIGNFKVEDAEKII